MYGPNTYCCSTIGGFCWMNTSSSLEPVESPSISYIPRVAAVWTTPGILIQNYLWAIQWWIQNYPLPWWMHLKQFEPIWMQTRGWSKPATWCEKLYGMYTHATATWWHAPTHCENTADSIWCLFSTQALFDWWIISKFQFVWCKNLSCCFASQFLHRLWCTAADGEMAQFKNTSWIGSDARHYKLEILKCPYLIVGDVDWFPFIRASHPDLCWVASMACATVPATSNAITAVDPRPRILLRCLPAPCLGWTVVHPLRRWRLDACACLC